MELPAGWKSEEDSLIYREMLSDLHTALTNLNVEIPETVDRHSIRAILSRLVELHPATNVSEAAIAIQRLIEYREEPQEPSSRWLILPRLKRSTNRHSHQIFQTIVSFVMAELTQMKEEGEAMLEHPVENPAFFDIHFDQFKEAFLSAKELRTQYSELPFNETEYLTLASMILSEVAYRPEVYEFCMEQSIPL